MLNLYQHQSFYHQQTCQMLFHLHVLTRQMYLIKWLLYLLFVLCKNKVCFIINKTLTASLHYIIISSHGKYQFYKYIPLVLVNSLLGQLQTLKPEQWLFWVHAVIFQPCVLCYARTPTMKMTLFKQHSDRFTDSKPQTTILHYRSVFHTASD